MKQLLWAGFREFLGGLASLAFLVGLVFAIKAAYVLLSLALGLNIEPTFQY